MLKVRTLNNIATVGLQRLPDDRYQVGTILLIPMELFCVRTTCTIWKYLNPLLRLLVRERV